MLARGTQVAGYRVEGVVGEGGFGVVYEATQLSLERTVALKLLARDLSKDFAFVQRFRREGLLQAAIDHPHIVAVYEAGESEQGLFIAMRLIRGPNLRQMIVARELDASRTVRLLNQVAGALDEAHSMGLVHRDIKPSNILIDGRRDHAYLADFGVTRARGRTQLTKTGHFIGTLDYIAPEQINGLEATEQTDIYALGAVIFEAFTGSVPFPKASDVAVLYAHLSDPPPRVTEKRPDLPHALDEVVARALAKDPGERHASAGELLEDVERALGDLAPRPLDRTAPNDERRARTPETAVADGEPTRAAPREAALPVESDRAPALEPPTHGAPEVTTREAAPALRVARDRTPLPPDTSTRDAAATTPSLPSVLRRRAGRAAIAAVSLTAVVVGLLAGRSLGTGEVAPPGFEEQRMGDLAVRFPAGWERTAARPVPGLALSNDVALASSEEDTSGVLRVGRLAGSWPTFLPRAFRERVPPRQLERQRLVRLGKWDAFHYPRLTPRGFPSLLELFVIPQPVRAVVMACSTPTAAVGALPSPCDRMAATVRISGAKPYALRPSPGYARAVNAALRTLDASRRRAAGRLRRAKTQAGQASAARSIAATYASAATRLAQLKPTPFLRPANDRVVRVLRQTRLAYERLATAAQPPGDRGGYDKARRDVAGNERRLRRELAALRLLGFRV